VGLVFTLKDVEIMGYANDLSKENNEERMASGKKRVKQEALRRLTPALECFSNYLRKRLVYVYPPQLLPKSKQGTDVGSPFFMVLDEKGKGASYVPGQLLMALIKEKQIKVEVLEDDGGGTLRVKSVKKEREYTILPLK